ncbi:hypothetical protein CBS101457_006191 [Exobasidium rhododendri]|nr:hypothetical protein CBS101457_006191 [Exobasidium rhododendri]
MSHHIKNADGTVDMNGLGKHLDFVKGKYAQNAKNYEANTGQTMNIGGKNTEETKGAMQAKVEEPTTEEEQKKADGTA